MGDNLTYKILKAHCVEGEAAPGESFGLKIDQTLTQDATGTVAYLQLEAMGVDRVRTELSVSYVDHNTLQTGFENADDHRYLQSVAARCGIVFSRPGNGICHQVHLERFGVPGRTLLGSDSHTPTAGGLGMMAVGAGGLDVACAMAGLPFYLTGPRVVRVTLAGGLPAWVSAKDVILARLRRLGVKGGVGKAFEYAGPALAGLGVPERATMTGGLPAWVSAKDVILALLRRLGVKGGVGKAFEYAGPALAGLGVPERATITNMGAELGATTSIFPSDEVTRRWLTAQQREEDFAPLAADPEARYEEEIELDLSGLEPLIALPHSPGNVVPVSEVAGRPVDQVCVGSCTNSSLRDLATVAAVLRGRKVHAGVSLTVSPGSRQVLEMIARSGILADLIGAGARLLECACGPCIGMGQAPATDAVTLRTFNRNFEGRTGTASALCHLCSPQTAAASALSGRITDPRTLGSPPEIEEPDVYAIDESLIVRPPADGSGVDVIRGPNIRPIPRREPLLQSVEGAVLIRVGDNVTTDHIMPAGSRVLPLRSNIPAISEHVFAQVDPDFARRAREKGGGFILGGENYGQGSSREHAALAPMHLGVIAVIAKSFARIHQANLVNFGILPLTFSNPADWERTDRDDVLAIQNVRAGVDAGRLTVLNRTRGRSFEVTCDLSERDRGTVKAGGRLGTIGG